MLSYFNNVKVERLIMSQSKRLFAICLANYIWSVGSFVNVVFLFFIPAKFEVNEIQTGIIMSLVSVAIFFGTIIYPKLIVRYSPIVMYKYAVMIGAICYLIASIFYDKFFIVVTATLCSYVTFSLTRGLNKKIISLAIEGDVRRKAYSYSFALANFGGVFAGVLAPFVFNLNVDYMQYIFLVNCGSSILSYLILQAGVRDVTDEPILLQYKDSASFISIDKRLLLATSIIYFGFFQISYLIPKSIEYNYSLHIYSLAIVINTSLCVFASPVLVKVLSALGINEYRSIRTGSLLMVSGFVMYNFVSIPTLIIATTLFAIGEVLFITNLDTYLLKIYDNSNYDRVLIKVRLLAQINRAIGPLIASICIMYLSYSAAFAIVIVVMLFGLIPLSSFNRKVLQG